MDKVNKYVFLSLFVAFCGKIILIGATTQDVIGLGIIAWIANKVMHGLESAEIKRIEDINDILTEEQTEIKKDIRDLKSVVSSVKAVSGIRSGRLG